jgi:hypothetical protein
MFRELDLFPSSGEKGRHLLSWASATRKLQARPSREKPPPGPLRDQGRRAVPLQRRPELQKGPGTYKEALTNTYPEDKLTKDDQNSILEALGEVLCRPPKEKLPHLKS